MSIEMRLQCSPQVSSSCCRMVLKTYLVRILFVSCSFHFRFMSSCCSLSFHVLAMVVASCFIALHVLLLLCKIDLRCCYEEWFVKHGWAVVVLVVDCCLWVIMSLFC